ncbi:hypothetical protein ATE68_22545 [Sphingopyxis sp. H038]|nr:hypothetical protein ATE78_21795 [Sphingopyxis sp. H012]KTE06227.1 hypothetical protein ATE70_22765 [Sphingopyxis sp. H053]KTE20373.1 hypothetical protein ATE75_21275 [Sphingopyxis sp. H080]KTE30820.1 hypothetical protein ATE68_22545 [Sphingopyxis sp. H038]KTE37346.1 hypothetical protein ATE73_22095 [Sphingopyxis sp. H077]KTE39209.1 hypothetical protein ATE77_21985 [Sphingopyxis sp. H005]KTE60995.1 hypothetical protein ATE74_21705 [Sphingopyxis sp. H085]
MSADIGLHHCALDLANRILRAPPFTRLAIPGDNFARGLAEQRAHFRCWSLGFGRLPFDVHGCNIPKKSEPQTG